MRQLTGLDTSFLTMESPTTYGHVSGLMVLDPSGMAEAFTTRHVRDVLEARLHLLGPFRWRLVEVPFGIDRPYWANDPAFDLDFHVREIGLAPPGDKYQLAEQVSRIAARPLDRSRPLWELYVLHGLEGGRVALLTKMHHAAIDGASGMEILTTLLDLDPEPRDVPPPQEEWKPETIPSEWEMLNRGYLGLALQPAKLWRAQRRALRAATGWGAGGPLRVAGRPDGSLLTRPPSVAPRTSFNRTITPHRRFSYGTLSLDEVKAVKNAHGVTVNDVVLAICTGAVRRWLLDHRELPADPLLAMVPVSVRTEQQKGSFGNQVSMMVVPLPTNVADPAEHLRRVHEATKEAKERFKAVPADLLQDFSQFATPAVMAQAARAVGRLRMADYANPPFNLVVSNVPGPSFPLYCAGARLVGQYPVSAIGDGLGLNITVLSYLGNLDFGLIACRELVPDLWNLLGYLGDALEDLLGATVAAS